MNNQQHEENSQPSGSHDRPNKISLGSCTERILESAKQRIRHAVSETGKRKKLTVANLKSIVRYVLTHDYIMSEVQDMMNSETTDDQAVDSIYTSKFTRAKVKELTEKNYPLPWPVFTPVKSEEFSKKLLLEQEYSDEGASDEDYQPNEEELKKDEDDDSGRKRKRTKPPTKSDLKDSQSEDEDSFLESEDEDFLQDINSIFGDTEADKIALRTRSKLCLDDTPLGTEEEALIPPIVTGNEKEIDSVYSELKDFQTPIKEHEDFSKQFLLQHEYSDESASDEDYHPSDDELSEDDLVTSRKKKKTKVVDKNKTETHSDDEDALVIALPDSNNIIPQADEDDTIAFRTRSKFCLNNTALETIEASFMPPDITVDMYDTHCDDKEWTDFLFDLNKPYAPDVSIAEETDEDPEFKVQDEEEMEDDDELEESFQEISNVEAAVPDENLHEGEEDDELDESMCEETDEIAKEELNALLDEIMEFTHEDVSFLNQVNKIHIKEEPEEEEPAPVPTIISIQNARTEWMIPDERRQLAEQMRMHVQLLTQFHLLSHGNTNLSFVHETSKMFLEELKMFATRERALNQKSAFDAENLDGALELVNEYAHFVDPSPSRHSKHKHSRPVLSPFVRETIATSTVFIYPELLPECGFNDSFAITKVTFSTAEDNLIALGLEQFAQETHPVEYIHMLLMPTKKLNQLHIRVRNCKWKFKPTQNAIAYYFKYKQAPLFRRTIRLFDPNNRKVPAEYPPEILPKWMAPFSKIPPKETKFKIPEPPKYKQILPRVEFVPVLTNIPPFGQCILPAALTPVVNPLDILKGLPKKCQRRKPVVSKALYRLRRKARK